MKTLKSKIVLVVLSIVFSFTMNAQENLNTELVNESKEALKEMIEKTPKLESLYNDSYGYVVFPKVTKAAIAFGGAFGNGIVFKNHQVVGSSKLKQATIGVQLGGQQYTEVIFFEDQVSFERFISEKLKFNAQLSAVAIKEGVSLDAPYQEGVAVFTTTKGGFMYEASVGGQHFKYEPKI